VSIFDEDAVLEVRVRRMHGRIWTAGVEVLEVVPRPRRRGRGRPFERNVRPVGDLMDSGAVLAVALAVLLLADVAVRIT